MVFQDAVSIFVAVSPKSDQPAMLTLSLMGTKEANAIFRELLTQCGKTGTGSEKYHVSQEGLSVGNIAPIRLNIK